MKMVKVVRLNLIDSLSKSRGAALFVEGNGLPMLMLDFACGKGRVLLVYVLLRRPAALLHIFLCHTDIFIYANIYLDI